MDLTLRNRLKLEKICFLFIFIAMYIFFRYVHPIVPWTVDDWMTMGGNLDTYVRNSLPGFGMASHSSCSFLGAVFGYISAFVIYPLNGDYILSFVITAAMLRAVSVTIVVASVYTLLSEMTKKPGLVALGTGLFFISAFVIFKTSTSSIYLFWTYNYCTIFYYTVPSCLASAFFLYLVKFIIDKKNFELNLKTSLMFVLLFFVMFSFLPAALLIAVIAFINLFINFIGHRDILKLFKEGYFYFVTLILFAVKCLFEFSRTFGSGYFDAPTDLFNRFQDSFRFLFGSFSYMNKLFLLLAVTIFGISIVIFCVSKKHNFSNFDKEIVFAWIICGLSCILCGVYFLLFGVISPSHIIVYSIPCRMDTLYVFYFLFLMLLTLSLVYIVNKIPKTSVFVPLFLFLMFCIVINPVNSYSDSIYIDTTPKQRYEIMSNVVEAAKIKDSQREQYLDVYSFVQSYSINGMGYAMYIHNITNSIMDIQFVYDENIKTVNDMYFE